MFTMRSIGIVHSPHTDTSQVPKGLGARHEAEGVLEILPEFEEGLKDIEGFSHLFVIWVFDRSEGFQLVGRPPTDPRPHGVFATRSPFRPNPIGLTRRATAARQGCGHARWNTAPRYQTLPVEHSDGPAEAWLAGRGGAPGRRAEVRRGS